MSLFMPDFSISAPFILLLKKLLDALVVRVLTIPVSLNHVYVNSVMHVITISFVCVRVCVCVCVWPRGEHDCAHA